MQVDLPALETWIGKRESRTDVVNAGAVSALAAVLDWEETGFRIGDPLPVLWHWLMFPHAVRQSALGEDGSPERGGFLPPVTLPSRMWAGSEIRVQKPLRVGDEVRRDSRIDSVQLKEGRSSGKLVFLCVIHEYSTAAGLALEEKQHIVYRDNPAAERPKPAGRIAPVDETWRWDVRPDPVLLFRYSALTFNAHRIHYDREYTVNVEGYPGLVVHGPLIATLLLEVLHRHAPQKAVSEFSFRALYPLFDDTQFSVCGRPEANGLKARLWARNAEGLLAMEAHATLRG